MEDILSTDTLISSLLHISINCHHVVPTVLLESMASEKEQSIDILAKERGKVLQGLEGQRERGEKEGERERRKWEEIQKTQEKDSIYTTVSSFLRWLLHTFSISVLFRLTRDTTLNPALRRTPAKSCASFSGVLSLRVDWR